MPISDAKGVVQLAVVGGMLSSSLGGMAVANVLRRLDNVVKEYSASVANIATAILCSFLFPEAFQVTTYSHKDRNTQEAGYKKPCCPKVKLSHMWIFPISSFLISDF